MLLGSRGIRAQRYRSGFIPTDMTAALSDEVRAEWAKKIPCVVVVLLKMWETSLPSWFDMPLCIRSGDSGRWWYEYVIEQNDCCIRRQPYHCSQQDRFRDCPGRQDGDTPLSETVARHSKEKYQKPGNVFLGVTQSAGPPVSGLVIFAKTSKALTRLNENVSHQWGEKDLLGG